MPCPMMGAGLLVGNGRHGLKKQNLKLCRGGCVVTVGGLQLFYLIMAAPRSVDKIDLSLGERKAVVD